MDISELFPVAEALNAGAEFKMKGPAGEETGVTLVIAGPYSETFRRARLALADRSAEKARSTGGGSRNNFRGLVNAEDQEALMLDFYSEIILGWDGILDHGQPFIRTPANAKKLLTAAPWWKEQVEAIVNDKKSFAREAAPGTKGV